MFFLCVFTKLLHEKFLTQLL